jgi:HAD superfamily hydrolase (TIGR01509 family)
MPGGTSRLRALIFDVDGTLAETEELHRRAFNLAFAQAGLDWRWDRALYGRLLDVTGGKERIRHFIDSSGGEEVSAAGIAAIHASKTAIYGDLVAKGDLSLRPGVVRLLGEAREAGLKLAIATTTTRANVEALLAAALGPDGASWFDAIAAGDAVPAKKPAPDIYLLALDRLGLASAECVAFEDTLNGLRSALAAGIPAIVTISAYGGAGPFPGALKVLPNLDESGEGGPVDLPTLARWRDIRPAGCESVGHVKTIEHRGAETRM